MSRIGFIGLGTMGSPMAGHLLSRGHTVVGFDVSKAAVGAFADAGGIPAASIGELVGQVDVIFTMVPAAEQAFEVYEGREGIFQSASASQVLVDCSTLGVDAARMLHAQAVSRGLRFLDAPVTGAAIGAVNATLVFIAGGEWSTVEEIRPILLCMGSKCVHAGAGGSGQAIKVCNNMAAGMIKAAICEAFVLGERLGIDPKILFEVASQGSAQSFALNKLCPVPGILPNAPSSHGYRGGFATKLMQKDMRLAHDAATQSGAPLPVTQLVAELFATCAESGFADMDNAVLYQYLRGVTAQSMENDATST